MLHMQWQALRRFAKIENRKPKTETATAAAAPARVNGIWGKNMFACQINLPLEERASDRGRQREGGGEFTRLL